MKTIKTYIPIFLFILTFTGIGLLQAQPENLQEIYLTELFQKEGESQQVAPLPFNTAAIASEALFQKLVENHFSGEPEEQVAPLPFDTRKIAEQYRKEQKWKSVFIMGEEAQIDDLPPAVKKFMAEYSCSLLAESKRR
jgi:hypothetical protein